MDTLQMNKQKISKNIDVKGFKKGQIMSWSVTTQAENRIIVELVDDEQNSYFIGTKKNMNIRETLAEGSSIIKGNNLKLRISSNGKALEKASIKNVAIKSDEGYELGNMFILSGEDSTYEPDDKTYNDVYVSLIAWNNKDFENLDNKEITELINLAYTYCFPLVLTENTKIVATNTEKADLKGHAPVNVLIHAQNLATADFKDVVTPNVDTLYTQAWLDIEAEPMVYVKPDAGKLSDGKDRFFTMQILDAYTNTPTVLEEAGTYAICSKNWNGELKAGIKKVTVSTDTVWLIGRVLCDGKDDIENVKDIQNNMVLKPLSYYLDDKDYNPTGEYTAENSFVPYDKTIAMDLKEFFDTANQLMIKNPPKPEDKEFMELIKKVKVGAGLNFDDRIIPYSNDEFHQKIQSDLLKKWLYNSQKFTNSLGIWEYYDKPIGDFGIEYDYRAMIAVYGLGANTVEIAIYPKTNNDVNGEKLSGENNNTYILEIPEMPPVLNSGFWSITAYNEENHLISNENDGERDVYSINDRSEYNTEDDGTVKVILSAKKPKETDKFYLPICSDKFHLVMRIYLPDMDKLKTFKSPTIKKI